MSKYTDIYLCWEGLGSHEEAAIFNMAVSKAPLRGRHLHRNLKSGRVTDRTRTDFFS